VDIVLFGCAVEFKGESFHVTHSMISKPCLPSYGYNKRRYRLVIRQHLAPGMVGSLAASERFSARIASTARDDSLLLSVDAFPTVKDSPAPSS